MIDKLKEIKKRYLDVEGSLSKPETVLNMKLYTSLNKEYKNLGKIVSEYDTYLLILGGIKEAKEIISFEKDEEFREIAKSELENLQQKQKKTEKKL
ncbi:MAG: PCRF domain-containing protein, partial [Marinoscillum sp.]